MTIEHLTTAPLPPIDDTRVRFYLDHQQAIETWGQLRREANDALHDLLLDLVDVLAEDAQSLADSDIDVRAETHDRRKPRIAITRRSWRDSTGQTPATIVIEWRHPPIDDTGELHLYVGVRVGERRRRDQRLSVQLSALAPTLRRQLGRPWERETEGFPVWRWILLEGASIDEVALLEQARAAAWRCWQVTAEHIDRLLADAT